MALNIKSKEADELARELARRRNLPITTVIIDALKVQLAQEKRRVRAPGIAQRMQEIGARYSALPILDERSDEEILGYADMLNDG